MIDSLVQYLLEEIAMDGDEGTSINDLASFISDFYSTHSAKASSSSTPPTLQQVDETFLTFIWNTLVDQPDVRVGLLKNLETPQPEPEPEPEPEPSTSSKPSEVPENTNQQEEEDSDLKPTKKPSRKSKPTKTSSSSTAANNNSTAPTHELTLVPSSVASLGYSHLSSVYSSQGELRVLASPQTAWKAITGSHARPTSITPMVYQVLQMVSRGRGEGATAVRLSRELGVDPKSVFHYIKVPQQLGIVKKISAIDQGSRTNRIIHVRYLSISPHWAVYTASEPKEEQGGGDNDGEEESLVRREQGQMSTISALYLSTNPRLVRNRIVRALKARGDGSGKDLDKCWMVQSEMASSIGLHSYSSLILRRLNALITALAQEGVLEKIAVTKKNRKLSGKQKGQVESVSTVQALRLVDPDKLLKPKSKSTLTEGANELNDDREEEEEEDEHSYPLANTSMQRQVLDLLLEADTRGLTNVEICDALGRYTLRTIDATLQRLGRSILPFEYFDLSTTSLTETVGRMKQTRWFSLSGYVSMRRERGLPDLKAEEKWELGEKEYEEKEEEKRRVRQEGEDQENLKQQRDAQWLGTEERRKWLKKFKTMDHVGKGLGEGPSKPRAPRKTKKLEEEEGDEEGKKPKKKKTVTPAAAKKKKVDPKGKGKEKAINQDDPGAEEEQEEGPEQAPANDGESSSSETPQIIKPRGRPRKHAPVEGKESWYQRKKRLDAERIAQGLEPEESYYQRKKREEKEDREREAAGLPPLVREKPKKARKSTSEPPKGEAEEEDQLRKSESPAPAPPKTKKRGRTSSSKPDAPEPTPTVSTSTASKKKESQLSKPDELAAAAQESEQREGQDRSIATPLNDQDEEEEEEEAGGGGGEARVEPEAERPKKRTRFSLAAADTINTSTENDQDVPATAQQPPRRRGRSSGPPLVPGPELDGAPVRTPPVPPTPPAPPASTSTTTSNTKKAPSRTPRRQARTEPFVEVPPVSSSKSTKRVATPSSSSSKPSKKTPSSSQPEVDVQAPPESDPTQSQGSPSAPSAVTATAPTQGGQPTEPDRMSPPPSHQQPSSATPQPPPKSQPQPRSKYKSRKSVTSKDNLTAITRQKEILEFITSQGGIVDAVPRLGEYIRDYHRSVNPSLQVFTMDRHVVNSTLSTLVKREQLKKTSVIGAKGERHDLYYSPSIELDSPEMKSFLDQTINNKKEVAHWDKFDRAEDIIIDELSQDIGNSNQNGGRAGGGGGEQGTLPFGRSDFPQPQDGPTEVRDYFRRQPIVVGASYGARYGAFSRARQLHKWLASFLFSDQPPQELLAHQDDQGFVLTHETFVAAMPLIIFTSIVPLPIESDELRQFLAEPNNLFLPLRQVPPNILSIVRPSLNKRKQAVWKTISTLMSFRLLSPLVESIPSTGSSRNSKMFATPVQAQSATHWRFNKTVPVYAFALDDAPLISLATLDSLESVSKYWTTLQKLATTIVNPLPVEEDPSKLRDSDFSLKFDCVSALLKRLRLKSKWKDAYHLIPDQRKFLLSLVQVDPNLVNSSQDRSKDLETWADALYAPVSTVVDFLQLAERRARQTVEAELNSKSKKRRIRKSEPGASGEGVGGREDDEWEEIEDEEKDAAASALHRKVQELAAQRQRDWTTIVDKFKLEHQQPSLDPDILSYLQRRFIDPRRQIDAVQLLFELRQLLPEPILAPGDELLRTVVPRNLRQLARQAKDPYAVSKQPNIRKRVRAAATSQSRAVVPRPTPARPSVIPSATSRRSPEPIEYGDQNEFLSQPAAPRPGPESGRRVRNFYTSEQDELLLDAVAILKARMKTINSRISYGVLERLFKGHKSSVLRSRSIVLLRKPEEQAYHDRLVEAWINIYNELRDTDENLKDPNFNSMTDFDIASFIRCLRSNVDKRALRLTRSIAKAPPPSVILPASLVALRTGYSIKKSSSSSRSSKWENYWVSSGVATTDRETSVARASISTPWNRSSTTIEEGGVSFDKVSREQFLTSAAIKMVISSSNETYTPEQGVSILSPFSSLVDQVVQQLKNQHQIVSVSSEPGRRIPGRNYSFDDKFFDKLDSGRITMERLTDAVQFENDLLKQQQTGEGGGVVFPIIPTEGEIMALVDLVSEGKVELTIDTSSLSLKTTRFNDFGTRQANDDDIECTVQIEPLSSSSTTTLEEKKNLKNKNKNKNKSSSSISSIPLPETFLPISSLDFDQSLSSLELLKKEFFSKLEQEQQEEEERGGVQVDLVRNVLMVIESKGVEGITLSGICRYLVTNSKTTAITRTEILKSLSLLLSSSSSSSTTTTTPDSTSSSSPLIFSTGFTSIPIYCSILHVPSYSIPLPLPRPILTSNSNSNSGSDSDGGKYKWLTPCIWTGSLGKVNKEVWNRCLNFLKSLLFKRSGMSFEELLKEINKIDHHHHHHHHSNTTNPGSSKNHSEGGGGKKQQQETTESMNSLLLPLPILTSFELKVILETLENYHLVSRSRQSQTVGTGTGTGTEIEIGGIGGGMMMIDWEFDRWNLKGCFWSS
ncbi:hypothetical protein JCM3765_000362 [Sporobolomyces pararoseus]